MAGLRLVHNALVGLGLRERVRLGCAGKVVSAFDIARLMALDADWCNSARGFMFALGCIQARSCHTGHCPIGVTTQDPVRVKALVVPNKADWPHEVCRICWQQAHAQSFSARPVSRDVARAAARNPDTFPAVRPAPGA
jgi:glutamate synthase domain-containing protein 2